MEYLSESWNKIFTELNLNIEEEINMLYKNKTVYPKREDIFNAFNYCDLENLNVVILGQDCYINCIKCPKNNIIIPQANGLAFSVNKEHRIPPSLKNIYKEMSETIDNFNSSNDGDLTYLAKQGVLLLNSALTVEHGKSNSHAIFWQPITDKIIKYISNNKENVVFILWGNFAKKKKCLIDSSNHYIIEGVHPSPLSARYKLKGTKKSFFGHNYFNKCNKYLSNHNKKIIKWSK
jgi:uracil-DNA glycosylase